MATTESVLLYKNPQADRGPYQAAEKAVMSLAAGQAARDEMRQWPGYALSPLRPLEETARSLSLRELHYKDESARFGLGSFKALGGAYAAGRAVQRRLREAHNIEATSLQLAAGQYVSLTSGLTLCCATDGNHGKSVAYGARRHGCHCVIFVHERVPPNRKAALEALGAEVVVVSGTYDDSVRAAQLAAERQGWLLISDTSEAAFAQVTADVMQGYATIALELFEQMDVRRLTHVFVQGGVGGLAAAMAGIFAERLGATRPQVIAVEPENAACLLASAKAGHLVQLDGDLVTEMEMLSCGEPSAVAWTIVTRRIDAFMAIADEAALRATESLRGGCCGDVVIDVGVSGAAGFAGLLVSLQSEAARSMLALGADSSVLVIGTEGANPLA